MASKTAQYWRQLRYQTLEKISSIHERLEVTQDPHQRASLEAQLEVNREMLVMQKEEEKAASVEAPVSSIEVGSLSLATPTKTQPQHEDGDTIALATRKRQGQPQSQTRYSPAGSQQRPIRMSTPPARDTAQQPSHPIPATPSIPRDAEDSLSITSTPTPQGSKKRGRQPTSLLADSPSGGADGDWSPGSARKRRNTVGMDRNKQTRGWGVNTVKKYPFYCTDGRLPMIVRIGDQVAELACYFCGCNHSRNTMKPISGVFGMKRHIEEPQGGVLWRGDR